MRSSRDERRRDVVAQHVGEAQRRDHDVRGCPRRSRARARRPRAASARPAWCGGCVRARRPRGRSRDRRSSSRRRASTSSARSCAPGCRRRAAAASRFIVPITLTSCRRRPLTRVESTTRCVCSDRVDLRGPHDAAQDRVRRVGLHELGASRAAAAARGCRRRRRARPRAAARGAARCGCPRTCRGR